MGMPSLPRLSSLDWNCFLSSVAKGGKWKKIEKLEEIWPTFTRFFIIIIIIIIKSLGYFDDSECKVDYTFPDSHFYIKGFRQYTAKIVTVLGVVSSFMSEEDWLWLEYMTWRNIKLNQ